MNDIFREMIHYLHPKTLNVSGLRDFLDEVETENKRLGWEAVIEEGDEDTSFKAAWYKERELTDEEQAKRDEFWKVLGPLVRGVPIPDNTGELLSFRRLKPLA